MPPGQAPVSSRWVAAKIAVVYAVVGGLWILLSDGFLLAVFTDHGTVNRLQTVKGWFYVAATALLLYWLVRSAFATIQRSEAALRASEERFMRRYQAISVGIAVYNREGIITHANKAAGEILNVEADRLLGDTAFDAAWQVIREDGSPLPAQEHPALITLRSRESVRNVPLGLFCQHTGSVRWLLANSEPLLDETTGEITEVMVTFLDVTERKTALDAVREYEANERRIELAAEEAKKQFYKGTIFSVTDGKLNLVTQEEIDKQVTPDAQQITLSDFKDLTVLRAATERVCSLAGMPAERTSAFVTAVGEAAANAVKHANSGSARIGRRDDVVQAMISDQGGGLDALILPKATLMRRFSTKPSMGLGYSLILASVDTVYLATGREGTSVLMEKAVAEPRQEMSLEALPDTW